MKILAIDLGKSKSVACVYEAETAAARYRKMSTGPIPISPTPARYSAITLGYNAVID